MKKPILLVAFLLIGFFGFGQNGWPYIIRFQTQDDTIYHQTQSVSGIHIDASGQELIHEDGTDWSSLTDMDTVYVYRGCFRIQQDGLQNWDFGSISPNNNVVLVKENDDDDGSLNVLILMHQSEDTLSFTFLNDTLTDFYYNSYHFMVCEMDTMLLFTTIDGDMAVSYAIPSYEHIGNCHSKGIVSTLIGTAADILNHIFNAESEINMLVDIENGDRESLMYDLGEMSIEELLGFIPIGDGIVLSYELYKHYINHLHNNAMQFHLGNASCIIQSIQQNESTNMIDVTISVINGEDIPNDYIWMNYWGQQVTSPNYVYYGVLCRAGNNFPTIQKCDYYGKELLEPHASMTQTFSFPVMAVEKIMFRPFLGFNYEYHNTSLQYGYKKVSLARYGNVVGLYPEFEINAVASPVEGGTVTGGGRYNFNTQVSLIATANDGYEFAYWEDGSESNPRDITVEGDTTYTAYFEELSTELPSVTTYEVTNITTNYAIASGEVTDEGGGTVTERGICFDTEHNPSIEGNHVANGAGLGFFTVSMSNLAEGTTYYVRAYATNEACTAYGDEVTFTTLTTPTVTTAAVTNIGEHTATGGGNVTDDGGSPITVRGICWSTSHNPTTSNSHATSGSGTGSFTVNMTGLTALTTYYVRAYATNSVGTEYGNEVSFTTEDPDWVDLGLPSGLLWAKRNVGASSPEGYGSYFAWGETSPKGVYDCDTYQYYTCGFQGNEHDCGLTKYCNISSCGYFGYTDGLTILQPGDDAATANYVGRMPTKEEWQELYNNCASVWTTQNGVNGRCFTGPNGNSLFLPAAGCHNESSFINAGNYGYYWSSSLYTGGPLNAWGLKFYLDNYYVENFGRYLHGFTVRPVRSSR